MYYYLTDIYELLLYIFFSLIISILLLMVSYIITYRLENTEKNLGYECGFEPFSDARNPFDVKFYLISILFIIFDIEIALFFPWAIVIKELMLVAYYTMYFFLFILFVGFLYEWKSGVLDWD